MPMPIKTNRGLTLSIEQAELFCSLKFHDPLDQASIQEVAAQLSSHFLTLKKRKKTLKYALIASGVELPDDFEFKFSDPFNWYNVFRVLIIGINRLLSLLIRPLLPVWFTFLGLIYLAQSIVAHVNNDLVSRNYWITWFFFNAFSAILAIGTIIGLGALIVTAGAPLLIASSFVWVASLFFDVGFDFYKYKTERESLENLREKLIAIGDYDLARQVLDKIKKMKEDRENSFITSNIIFLGGLLYAISALLPPAFIGLSIVGATLIIGAYSYLAYKKIKNSWLSRTGFLNHYVRKPCNNLLNNLKGALRPELLRTKNHGLTIDIPANPTLAIAEVETPVDFAPANQIASDPILKSTAVIEVKLNKNLKEAKNFNHFIEGVSKLNPDEKKELRSLLKVRSDHEWTRLLPTIVTKYEEEMHNGLYNCNLKRTIQICRNRLKSILLSNQKLLKNKTEENPEYKSTKKLINLIEKQLRFLDTMDKEFNGAAEDDLPKIKLSKVELRQIFSKKPLLDVKLKNIRNLLVLMGIRDFSIYKKQIRCWENCYATNSGRYASPFFDRPAELLKDTCAFGGRPQEDDSLEPFSVGLGVGVGL